MGTWTQKVGHATVTKRDGMESTFGSSWAGMQGHLKERVTQGIGLAPIMVRCAIDAVTRYEANWGSLNDPGDNIEVGEGLRKYFELDSNVGGITQLARWMGGLKRVYGAIAGGLTQPYDLVLYASDDGAKGKTALDGVKSPGATSASFTRQAFGFTDEWGHAEWQGFKGPLLMNMNWVAEPLPGAGWSPGEAFARVVVHEGSHRWAQTKDVMYKHNSAGRAFRDAEADAKPEKILEDVKKMVGAYTFNKLTPEKRQWEIDFGTKTATSRLEEKRAAVLQNVVTDRGEGHKPLVSLNVHGVAGKTPIDTVRWLENADSYAWFARRMWKLAGKPEK